MRAVLAALEAAAGERDAGAMKEHVSERYADAQGNDKRAIAQLVAFHLLRNQSVYLLTRVQAIEIGPPGEVPAESPTGTLAESPAESPAGSPAAAAATARADVLVAMAGTPIAGPEALVGLRADLYRFELALAEEEGGVWRVRSARWRPAAIDDFR